MSEHDRGFDQQRWMEYQKACTRASTDDILLIPGIEYEDADNVVHTPVWGEDVPFLGSGRPTVDLLRLAQGEGAVAVLAHPWRRNAISRYQPEWAPLLSAVEVWNRKYDGFAPRREAKKFAEREDLTSFASLDFHTRGQFFPLAMSIALAGHPSSASLIEAIRQGQCHAEFLGLSALRFTRGSKGRRFALSMPLGEARDGHCAGFSQASVTRVVHSPTPPAQPAEVRTAPNRA
jgi:hypothetical protein